MTHNVSLSHRFIFLIMLLVSTATVAQTPALTVKNKNEFRSNTNVDSLITNFDHTIWNDLLHSFVNDQGIVNYEGFNKEQSKLNSYLNQLSETPPEASWNSDSTLAFWINAYNAYTVKLILNNYPVNSIKDIKDPWNQRFIPIGEKWYTLNDIEHRIIRKMGEPRIHFALVCAAMSCPKLYNKAFNPNTLNEDLTKLTQEFLADSSKNEISQNSIKLSKIFKWYGKDFKTKDQDLIDFLNQYSEVKILPKAKKSFKDYNWKLNE